MGFNGGRRGRGPHASRSAAQDRTDPEPDNYNTPAARSKPKPHSAAAPAGGVAAPAVFPETMPCRLSDALCVLCPLLLYQVHPDPDSKQDKKSRKNRGRCRIAYPVRALYRRQGSFTSLSRKPVGPPRT